VAVDAADRSGRVWCVAGSGPGVQRFRDLTAVWLYRDDKQIKQITYREEQGESGYSVTVLVL
jgi:hypothetical protein